MKTSLKRSLARLPALHALAHAVSNRLRLHRHFGTLRRGIKARLYPNGSHCIVQTGPFSGLRYFDRHIWGLISNKWLGSYEIELADILQRIITTPYQVIYDIGCAEGWYVVGLATRMPSAQIVAFDTDPISRRQCRALAQLNNVSSRIQVHGGCGFPELNALHASRALIICDIEGAEVHLLDPDRAPALQRIDILVELHESSATSHDVESTLRQRFTRTHQITHIAATDRSEWLTQHAAQFAGRIPHDLLHQAVQEHRAPGNGWLWLQATNSELRTAH